MQRTLLLFILTAFSASPLMAASYTIDPQHTFVSFAINHLGFSTVRGKFDRQSGTMEFDPATKTASVSITIDASSIDTGYDKRDQHLNSPDFLNVVENPTIEFQSTAVTWNGDRLSTVTGDLTILGVSKPVTLKIMAMKCGEHPFNHKQSCGFDAEGMIKRSDFGVNYGIPMIGETMNLQVEVEAIIK